MPGMTKKPSSFYAALSLLLASLGLLAGGISVVHAQTVGNYTTILNAFKVPTGSSWIQYTPPAGVTQLEVYMESGAQFKTSTDPANPFVSSVAPLSNKAVVQVTPGETFWYQVG